LLGRVFAVAGEVASTPILLHPGTVVIFCSGSPGLL
jgi:hypothetical protein